MFFFLLQPNSMGIDPSDDRCLPFYNKMKELDMVGTRTRTRTLCSELCPVMCV